jgi:hypothetical protein
VVGVGSNEPRLVFEGSGFPEWWSDPRRIHILSERGDETHLRPGFVPFDPVKSVPAGEFQLIDFPGLPEKSGSVDSCSMTWDRRWLLCTVNQVEGDVYVADIEH